MSLNPFIHGRPIENDALIMGRADTAENVADLLRSQNNIVLFGPRGTGKTTFTYQLQQVLASPNTNDIEQIRMGMVYITLDQAFSWDALALILSAAGNAATSAKIKVRIENALKSLQIEHGISIKNLSSKRTREQTAPSSAREIIAAVLRSINKANEPTVVVFDEFQRLASWPEIERKEVLGMIRSHLMQRGSGHISLMFTGSQREGLRLLLENNQAPIFDQTKKIELPLLDADEVYDVLELNYKATGKPVNYEAIQSILRLAKLHPKRTQQLAWQVWNDTPTSENVTKGVMTK